MPKKITSEELDLIVQAIAQFTEGAGIEALFKDGNLPLTRRTLQRRLAQLLENKRLVTEGEGRALKYRIAPTTGELHVNLLPKVKAYGETYVPLSPEGQEIKKHIQRPRQSRRPVSYNPSFLEAYIPNDSAYLPEGLRLQLHKIGRSPDSKQKAGTFARDILNRLLIDLSWASSQLEGNTYSLLDTKRLIELGQKAEGKDAMETQMILNHKAAIEMIVINAEQVGFNTFTILNLHAQLSDGLLADPQECGRLRQRPIEISGSVYIPMAMPQRIEEYFRKILAIAAAIQDPFEQSFFVMAHLPYLQPFVDVNKRVSRLAANIPFIKQNLCPLSFIDVPQQAYLDGMLGVYEINKIELLRDVFIWTYERSCQQYVAVKESLVPPDSFRLKYRAELSETVRSIVLNRKPASEANISSAVPPAVTLQDHSRFIALVLKEFETLYEGNIARFRLTPSDLSAWQDAVKNQ